MRPVLDLAQIKLRSSDFTALRRRHPNRINSNLLMTHIRQARSLIATSKWMPISPPEAPGRALGVLLADLRVGLGQRNNLVIVGRQFLKVKIIQPPRPPPGFVGADLDL